MRCSANWWDASPRKAARSATLPVNWHGAASLTPALRRSWKGPETRHSNTILAWPPQLYDEALLAGADELATAARRAQAASATGDLDTADRIIDGPARVP